MRIGRRGFVVSAVAVLACWTAIAAGARQTVPASFDVAAALAAGRTDTGLVTGAAAAVADAEQAGERYRQALALGLLAQVHVARGEYTDAERVAQQAVAIWSDLDDPPNLVTALEQLADAQLRRRVDLDVAAATIARLRALRQTLSLSDPPGLARLLELDATLQTRRGQYAAARETLTRIAAMGDQAQLPQARRATLAYLSGDVAYLTGDITRAAADWESALESARLAYGSNHPQVITYLGRVAIARHAMGDMAAARDLRMTALQMAEASWPSCHPDLIGARTDLASSDEFYGDYTGARRVLDEALATSRQCLGPAHPATAQALGNAAYILGELGDLATAETLQREAVSAWTAARGESHPMVALALEQLAEIVSRSGRSAEALTLYQRTLALRTKTIGDDDPLVAQALAARAAVLIRQQKFSAALQDLDRAAGIYEKQGAVDEPGEAARAEVQLQRANALRALNQSDRARDAYLAALTTRERIFGASHPRVAEARALLARLDVERGSVRQAFDEAVNAETVSRDHLRNSIRYLPERQALGYAATRPAALDLIVTAAATGDAAVVRTAFDSVIRSRGVVLDELGARAQLGHGDAAISPEIMQRFVAARQRYANLTVQSLREAVPRDRLEAARRDADAAETLLARQSAAVRADLARSEAGFEQVLRALPSDSALVAFIRYEVPAGTNSPRPVYGAFIVGSAGAPVFVELGNAARIDGLVRAWRTQISRRSATAALATAGAALRTAVWDPVVSRIGAADRVFIVTDGLLSLVSFAALPRRGGGYLVEDERVLHVLATERDLLLPAEQGRSPSALIVGGPSFAGNRAVATVSALRASIDCRSAKPLAFPDLPGARAEAQTVSSLWAAGGERNAVMLSGADATETAVKEQLSGRRVVHLATHGFFLGVGCDPGEPGTRAVGGVVAANAKPAVIRNPLSLSGLAFAGADRQASHDTDDGILTAQEIASLDLHGTEWAVLSACDTGLGEIRSGEGVLGLRRAFQIAGARTVIMSLWSVDDQATRLWMESLYEARLMQHLDTAASVRAASLAVLSHRRAEGLSTHPFYWAAFVAAGDWR